MISLVWLKLKAFRMTVPSMILLVLASYRCLTSGESIQLVGVCASIVPFICQFKNFPKADDSVPVVKDILSSYILNLLLMILYLTWMLFMTWLGKTFLPGYVVNPYFADMTWIAICADVVFISAVIPICRNLNPFQRLIPGLVLTNAMLAFMMMAFSLLKAYNPTNVPTLAGVFLFTILPLTVGLIFASNIQRKK